MAYDEDTAWVLWPEYFEKGRSRSSGRRVRRTLAVERPTLQMLEEAVKGLGLEYVSDNEKSHPANWWAHGGLIRVENTMPKTQLIERVGERLKEN
jgi:signal recognition particle subunit SRP19